MRDIIIIGPKKTATTSLYHAINDTNITKHRLIAKESNLFLQFSAEEIVEKFQQPIIDISPEYFTSFRSIMNIEKFAAKRKKVPLVISLLRDPDKRFISHYSYMLSKEILTSDMLESEVETICINELNIWKSFSNITIKECNIEEAVKILEKELETELVIGNKNIGNTLPRSKLIHGIMKNINSWLIQIFPTSRYRILLASKLNKFIYKSNNIDKKVKVPKEFKNLIEKVRDN